MIQMKLPAVMIIGTIFIIASSGCVNKDNFNDNGIHLYVSTIYGNVSIDEQYSVILPMPLNIGKTPMFLEDEFLVMKGNASFNYTNTEYGIGLMVNSSEDFIITTITTYQPFVYYSLPVEDITKTNSYPQLDYYGEHYFRAYGNFTSANNTLEVKMGTYKENGCDYDYGIIKDTVSQGWQQIYGEYGGCFV